MERFGTFLDLEKDTIAQLYQLGKYHDIGKIYIDKNILTKKEKLNDNEYEQIFNHTFYSYELLKNKGYSIEFLLGVLNHHENYNGTGYPFNLRNDEIPFFAHLLRIIDSYDAITNNRAYQKAHSKEYALNELMLLRGEHYHPVYVDKFYQMMKA
ncbi:HD-GYP domain-containing protein [Oceanobacillus kimchii]|uniref:HD-GYP domain-containing protein n=2 Tax=Bacillaceae TaxID=186817 RepID=A0ABQ5TNI0_9BACI|nr:hypothetical protein MACH08_41470 [Oceanobacillus kimchii]